MRLLTTSVFLLIFGFSVAQTKEDSIQIRKIYDQVLTNGACYENLRTLCKGVGHRLSGSEGADKAVKWGQTLLNTYGFDKVYLQEIMVPHWERGTKELCSAEGVSRPLKISALGGSVSTNGALVAEVIEVTDIEALKLMDPSAIKGKIVFFSKPFDPKHIVTFKSYGACVPQRVDGAKEAAKMGAVAVLIRPMTHSHDDEPHTGVMMYEDGVTKIPAASLSNKGADMLSIAIKKAKNSIKVTLEMDCKSNPDKKSHNVIAEIKGSKYPEKVIVIGGHLDSWDLGEGAHDDGAGIVHSIEVLKTFKDLGIKPNHTIRVILYMNEENGNKGGKTYAEQVLTKGEEHLAALESDRGGFTPRGFSFDGTDAQLSKMRSFAPLFVPYQIHVFEKGYGGVDIGPLKNGKTLLVGFVPDSQRYFDFHHAETDVFESVNKRELELGAATMTSLIYLIDKYGVE